MRLAIVGAALASTAVWAGPAPAQNPPAVPAVERAVLAGTKLPDLSAQPVSFCELSVTIPANAASHIVAGSNAIFYQLGGSTEITTAGATKTLGPGEALFVAGGHEVFLKAIGDDPSRSLHFVLVRGSVFDSPVPTEPATVTELFRTPSPIPDLKPGAYEVNLTRVTPFRLRCQPTRRTTARERRSTTLCPGPGSTRSAATLSRRARPR